MIPILYSQNNLPIYLKEDIISYLESLHPNNQDKIMIEYETKWVSNKTIVIVLKSDLNGTSETTNNDEEDEIEKINNVIKYIDDLERKLLNNEN